MKEFQQKKKLRRILYSPLTIIVLAIILILLVKGVWNVYAKDRESATAKAMSQLELANLENQQASISSDISSLSTDEGVERQIRENFSMAKPGEQLVIIVPLASSTATDTEATSTGFFEGLWNRIKSAF